MVDERLTPDALLKKADRVLVNNPDSIPARTRATLLWCTAAIVAALDRQTRVAEQMGDQP